MRKGVDLTLRIGGGSKRRAIVEVSAAIPFTVPAVCFDVASQPTGLDGVFFNDRRVATLAGKAHELRQHIVEEKGEPDAFASAVLTDEVHAVIPVAAAHQGQAVAAETQPVVDRAQAMFVEGANVVGNVREIVIRLLIRTQRSRTQERHALVEHAGVADRRDIPAGCIREPEEVIGEMGTNAPADGRMPPVQHVPLTELAAGGTKELFTQEAGFCMHKGHRVL